MRRLSMGVGISLFLVAGSALLGTRGAGADPQSGDRFPARYEIPAGFGSLVGTEVSANSLMLVFEDEQGTIRILDYLKREKEIRPSIRIDRR